MAFSEFKHTKLTPLIASIIAPKMSADPIRRDEILGKAERVVDAVIDEINRYNKWDELKS